MQIEAVFFDLFDTLLLIDTRQDFYTPALIRLHNFLANKGINIPFEDFSQAYFEVRDKLYEEASKSLKEPHFNIRVSLTLKKLGYNYEAFDPIVSGATSAFADEFARYVSLDKGTISLLQKLQGKYLLGLISNFALPECVHNLLKKFHLNQFFDTIIISGEINRRKPSPEIFQKALKTLNVEASKAIFVGDTLHLDVKGAKNAGMKTVLIKRKASMTDDPKSLIWKTPEENPPIKPDIIIDSLKELLSILERR
ncbi:MAG: HAD family hydrolase [Candidatus Bathyarchaeota archaeon]|nr:HAD family hydrolase [Candidatus Bathyarchaeota archaeon]